MDLVVSVAIGILSIVFVGSLLALIFICRHKYCHRDAESKPILKFSKNGQLESQADVSVELSAPDYDMQLQDMYRIGPNLERMLRDHSGFNDTSGLIQHCLSILKLCHLVTDKLSGLSFNAVHAQQEIMDELRQATRRITPRADDMVRSMYPPLNVGLLEARASALVFAVSNLALVFKSAFSHIRTSDWLTTALSDMETHLECLRTALRLEEAKAASSHHECPQSIA